METYNFDLDKKRKCKCVRHIGTEHWHKNLSGYSYHRCRCLSCTDLWNKYMADRYLIKGRNGHVPQVVRIICITCGSSFESNRQRKYCKPECRPLQDKDTVRAKYYAKPPHERSALARRRYALWIAQNGICAMCHVYMEFSEATLDHDHACCDIKAERSCGNCDRGVLHNRCNRVLGAAQDNTKLLAQAIAYLDRADVDASLMGVCTQAG